MLHDFPRFFKSLLFFRFFPVFSIVQLTTGTAPTRYTTGYTQATAPFTSACHVFCTLVVLRFSRESLSQLIRHHVSGLNGYSCTSPHTPTLQVQRPGSRNQDTGTALTRYRPRPHGRVVVYLQFTSENTSDSKGHRHASPAARRHHGPRTPYSGVTSTPCTVPQTACTKRAPPSPGPGS